MTSLPTTQLEATGSSNRPLPWYVRLAVVAAGVGLAAGLVTAIRLTPDPDGLGTHHQLGLQPCTLRRLFNMRCPACGMTTSWAHLVRGQVLQAVRANTGGAMLCLLAMFMAPWLLASGLCGRWFGYRPGYLTLPLLAAFLLGVTLVQWVLRL